MAQDSTVDYIRKKATTPTDQERAEGVEDTRRVRTNMRALQDAGGTVNRHPLIKSTDPVDAENERKAMEGRVHPGDAAERFYRRMANSAYGGNIYGDEKGAGWDRTIPKEAADALRRNYGITGERAIRRGKFPK